MQKKSAQRRDFGAAGLESLNVGELWLSSRESTSPELSPTKKAIFYVIMFVFVLLSVEGMAQLWRYVRNARIPVATETFQVRSFTRLVDDARHVTAVPDSTNPNYGNGWGISTDAYGFRRGAQRTEPDCPNVVFIGDSVPFGYGEPDNASMPSKLFERLQKANDVRCVINAAIPSYSLFQAVARFEHEIAGKFNISALYLQFFDPATQFSRLGADWRPEVDWTTEAVLVKKKWQPIASVELIRDQLLRLDVITPIDEQSLNRYRLEIRQALERLHDLAVRAGVKQLIVAPITVPYSSYQRWPPALRSAIDAANDESKQFSVRHADTSFLDTIGLLRDYPEDDVFVDKCCHMTERGNDLVAEQVQRLIASERRQ